MTTQPTYRVVIDDLRTHPLPARHLRTLNQALAWLSEHESCDELWLDHDLGLGADGQPETIRPFVRALEEAIFDGTAPAIGMIYVHTANPVGASFMTSSRLLSQHCRVIAVTFPTR